MLVTENSNLAYSQLEMANNAICEGSYSRAYNLLNSSYNLALSVDNSALLCKITLSAVIFKIACPNLAEVIPAMELENSAASKSFLNQTNEELLVLAQRLARRADLEKDKKSISLADLVVIYDVKNQIETEKSSSNGRIASQNAVNYISKLESVKSSVSKEPYYLAFLHRTAGDVCLAGENYSDAQKNYEEAAKIHTKERYLVEIGLDWYCLSRSYSLAGQKAKSVEAIQTALKYDKDAENTSGIVADYLAYSKILLKGGPTEEEKQLSEELENWAKKIMSTGK